MVEYIPVKLEIKSAHKLKRRLFLGCPDPFVQIVIEKQMLSSRILRKTTTPIWNESFEFEFPVKQNVEINIWNNQLFSKKLSSAFLGSVLLSSDLVDAGEQKISVSNSSYPNKEVCGYLVFELTKPESAKYPDNNRLPQIYNIPSNNNINNNNNNHNSNSNNNCKYLEHQTHENSSQTRMNKDRSLSTSEFALMNGGVGGPSSSLDNCELALPPGYVKRTSKGGKVSFINTSTGDVHYYHPGIPKFLRKCYAYTFLGPLPPGWESLQTDSGKVFFIDHISRTTQCSDPRLLAALAGPNGLHIVIEKMRRAGINVKEPSGSSNPRERRQSARENFDPFSQQRSEFELNQDPMSQSMNNYIPNGSIEMSDSRSQSSVQIVPNLSTAPSETDMLVSVTNGDNNNEICETELPPMPAQRMKISRPTSKYVLDNKDKIESKLKLMRTNLKELMLRKLCIIETSRDNILEESFIAVRKLKPQDLRKRLVIKFTDEEGLDYGGVAREWLYLLSETLFSCRYGLFEVTGECNGNLIVSSLSWVNENHLKYFHFIGRIIGIAIFHGYYIDADFSKLFYKRILSKATAWRDFKDVDMCIYKSLKWISENKIDEADLSLTFSIEQEELGEIQIIDLCDNGRNIPVTDNLKQMYIDKYANFHLNEKCAEQYQQIIKGITEVLPEHIIGNLNEDEFEVLLTGVSEISIDDWKRNTRYKHCSENDQVIQWFWKVVYSYNEEQRIKLLQFVTGSSRIPLCGFEGLRGSYGSDDPKLFTIKIIRSSSPQCLPRAHTCFNRLDLPPYQSYICLREKLTCAIDETCGFAVI